MAAGVEQEGGSEFRTTRGHTKLRGGEPPHPHSLSKGQFGALSAICNTFLPSLPLEASGLAENGDNADEIMAKSNLDDVSAYYRLGAVDAGVPEQVAGLCTQRLKPIQLLLVGAILWLLSTYFGTLLMCGFLCLSSRFPFVHRFADLPHAKREKVLRYWSHSPMRNIRAIFKLCKGYCMLCYYTKVGPDGHNRSWDAIGYSGPGPELSKLPNEPRPRPLDGKVMDAELAGADALRAFLKEGGFILMDDVSHLRSLSNQNESGKTVIGITCDAVVVGSGSGGGVAAGVLATGGQKVLVLERGQYFARDDLALLEFPAYAHMYQGGGILGTDCGGVNLLAGSTVGGGSAVNWAASFQTPQHVRREWAEELGLSHFGTDEYQRAMDAVCSRGGVHTNCPQESFQNAVFRKGCEELGIDIGNIPRNVLGQHSCGFCCFGCSTGQKQATSETWLVDAVKNGALILSNCQAKAVLHRVNSGSNSDKKREAVGVVAEIGNILVYVEARATVVACGALNTPPFLMQSGFQNRNIGRNFHCHPAIMAWGYFPEDKGVKGTIYDGPIMTAFSKQTANWESKSSAYGSLLEVPILHPGLYAGVLPWLSASKHREMMRKYPRTAHVLVLCRDRGGGRVTLDSNGKTTKILYSVQAEDALNMAESLAVGLRALVAAGATEIGTHHIDGESLDVSSSTAAELDDYLRRLESTVYKCLASNNLDYPVASAHQMGTCRMGADPKSSAVDRTGETWEAERLFLADSSVFPTASGVNPMITVQSIAYCTAHSVLKKLRA